VHTHTHTHTVTQTLKDDSDEDGEDGEPSTRQLAWETLEVVRHILSQNKDDKESELQLAEIHMELGECSAVLFPL
jgi:hypothetical protein